MITTGGEKRMLFRHSRIPQTRLCPSIRRLLPRSYHGLALQQQAYKQAGFLQRRLPSGRSTGFNTEDQRRKGEFHQPRTRDHARMMVLMRRCSVYPLATASWIEIFKRRLLASLPDILISSSLLNVYVTQLETASVCTTPSR